MSAGIHCAFTGTLGRDVELRTSKSGKRYMRLAVRVGERWVNVMAFGDCASDLTSKLLTKGAAVYVEGNLSLDEWETADGTKRTGLSVMSWHVRVAEIGERRPKRDDNKLRARRNTNRSGQKPARDSGFYNDPIEF